jgi:hypothetical protein
LGLAGLLFDVGVLFEVKGVGAEQQLAGLDSKRRDKLAPVHVLELLPGLQAARATNRTLVPIVLRPGSEVLQRV